MKILELAIQILEAFNVYMAPEPGGEDAVGQLWNVNYNKLYNIIYNLY